MSSSRLETFSDGVLAIIITIMVLEFQVPHESTLASLRPLIPVATCYVMSFVYLGIYWNNHHHMLHVTRRVNGRILWANLHLLFWLSLVPFVTAWMGENNFARLPVALYGFVMWMSGVAYYILTRTMVSLHGRDSLIDTALRNKFKERVSLMVYALAVVLAFANPAYS